MKVLVIQHSAADRSAAVGEFLDKHGHSTQTIRIDKQDPIPNTVDADVLMMFGGACSLTGEEPPSWVAREQELIRRYVDRQRRVLGICLGSQMLAAALGAGVRRNHEPEVGWHTVRQVNPTATASGLPDSMTVLQWHQDTFDLPSGATHLFESDACQNQAFCIDDRIFGFQFHLEANLKTCQVFLAVSSMPQREGSFVQTAPEITAGIEQHLEQQTQNLNSFLQRFLAPAE
ncbi:MAG: type 1 glutamine amidotransferase [Rubripirellula sp.]